MWPCKVVVILSGSIAAYKGCDLVSKLKKKGCEVRVIMTPSAEKFVSPVTLQALSGASVITDDFLENQMMAHIELGLWCDLAVFYPATAQSLNSLAVGVGQDTLHSFFLAYPREKPFFIAPAMNTRMLNHPTTQRSLKELADQGYHILPCDSGTLACGETGAGRVMEPAQVLVEVEAFINSHNKKRKKKILITAGGTRESIDGVRTLTNMSTGRTGADLADAFHDMGYQVLLLTSRFSVMPRGQVKVDTFESFQDIANTLQALGKSRSFDMILHAAAISDYSIESIETPEGSLAPGPSKMSSNHQEISIKLRRNEKLLPRLKDLFTDNPLVVGFKLTSTESKQEQARAIFSLFTDNAVDYVVHNDMQDINQGQRKYLLSSQKGHQSELSSTLELAQSLHQILENTPLYQESQRDLMS